MPGQGCPECSIRAACMESSGCGAWKITRIDLELRGIIFLILAPHPSWDIGTDGWHCMSPRLVLYTVFFTGSIMGVSYSMFGSLVPVFARDELGASYTEIAWIGSAYFMPYMVVPLLVGMLLARYNNTYLLVGGVALNTLSIFLLSIAGSPLEISVYRMMTGLALSLVWPAYHAIIARYEEGRANNLARFMMFYVVGYMAGPLIGNMLIESGTDYRTLFQISAAVMASASISVILRSRPGTGRGGLISVRMFRQFARYPVVLVVTAYSTITYGSVLALYPAFMREEGVHDTHILLLFFMLAAGRAASLACSPVLSRRPDLTMIGTVFAISAGMAVSYFATSTLAFAATMLLLGFGFGILFPFILDLILSRAQRGMTGPMIGVFESIFGIGWAAGSVIGGYLAEFYGVDMVYVVLSATGILVGVLSLIRRRSLAVRAAPA